MIQLTQKEKADRFDALQAAFSLAHSNYTKRKTDAENRYEKSTGLGVSPIGAYNKGLADGYLSILADLERWTI